MPSSIDPAHVFSTSVEVFPDRGADATGAFGLLHVRGGVSGDRLLHISRHRSSPRPWRCFPLSYPAEPAPIVFSTSVEVFPRKVERHPCIVSLLHVRGGVSGRRCCRRGTYRSSPRPWRCFLNQACAACSLLVFSTSVEVFPKKARNAYTRPGLLHVRGGVSGWRN